MATGYQIQEEQDRKLPIQVQACISLLDSFGQEKASETIRANWFGGDCE